MERGDWTGECEKVEREETREKRESRVHVEQLAPCQVKTEGSRALSPVPGVRTGFETTKEGTPQAEKRKVPSAIVLRKLDMVAVTEF